MMKSIFFVVIVCATVALAGDFSTLFVSDCYGSVQFGPTHGLINSYLGFGKLASGANAIFTAYRERLQCACPSLTDEEFERLFLPGPALILNLMAGPAADKTWQASCGNLTELEAVINAATVESFPEFVLPATCSYETWRTTGKCHLQSTFTAIDATVRLSVEKCANSMVLPYVALTCSGTGCANVFKPCETSNDCQGDGFICNTVKLNETGTLENYPGDNNIFTAIYNMALYDSGDETPGCKSPSSILGPLLDFVRNYFDGGDIADTNTFKFCGPQINFQDPSSIGEMFEVQDRCNITSQEECHEGAPICVDGQCTQGPSSCSTRPVKIDCTTKGLLTAFDGAGVVPASGKSPHPIPVSGVTPLTAGAKVLLSVDCSGLISVTPTSFIGLAGKAFALEEAAKFVYSKFYEIETCRRNSTPVLTEEAFKIRYLSVAEKLLYYLTSPVTPLSNYGPEMSDWSFTETQKKLAMPSTCTYAHWKTNGFCALKYVGLQSLLGLDITLNARVKACPAGNPIPQVYVECVGDACIGIDKPIPCSINADCPGNLFCKDLNVEIFDRFNATDDADFIGQMAFGNITNHQSCRGLSKLKVDIRNLLLTLAGKTPDSSLINKMCFVDVDHVESQLQNDAWVNGQTSTSGSVVTLTDLQGWSNAPTTDPLPTPSGGAVPIAPSGVGSASSVVYSAVTLAGGLLAAFLF